MAVKVVPGKEVHEASVKTNVGRLDERGREIVDGRPMEPPVGYRRTPSISEMVRDMVRGEALRQAAERSGVETFAEADDFDVGDDYDPSSPYEEYFEPTSAEELQERHKAAVAADLAKAAGKPVPAATPPVEPPKAAGAPPAGGDGGKSVSG